MKIVSLKMGQSGIIEKVDGQGAMRKRLLDMGLTPNTRITLFKRAPMGDPVELVVRGYHLTLRISETEYITLKEETAE